MTTVGINLGERTFTATVEGNQVVIGESSFTAEALGHGLFRVTDGTRQWMVAVAGPSAERWIYVDGHVAQVVVHEASQDVAPTKSRRAVARDLSSPMPATVLRVLVKAGDQVARGDTLIVLEAMKMELPIRAERDGVIRAVHCKAGELVQPGVALLELQ